MRNSIKHGKEEIPKTEQHRKFCDRWLIHFDHKRAAQEAGYSKDYVRTHALKLARRYHVYLSKRKEKVEVVLAKKIALDQQDIIDQMVAIGFANVQDYIVVTQEEREGKMVTIRKPKPVEELTRNQAAALSAIIFNPDGTVTYSIPDEKSRHPYLKDLGQHLGLFHPKLIQEHRHQHLHAQLDFKDLDDETLAQAEELIIKALGPAGKRMLGIVHEGEFEEVKPE